MSFPQWVILHVPHDSVVIPHSVRGQFVLDNIELATELERMTDHHTLTLFSDTESEAQVVRAPVSRLVVDVERFARDDEEPMAARGMGVLYTVTSTLKPLRRPISAGERDDLIRTHYIPHHARLESVVGAAIEKHGRCLVIDCHSFPSSALPYEMANADRVRPDICIGTDEFHTSKDLATAFVAEFQRAGWLVEANYPFSGALVPNSRYRRDRRVSAVMVDVNRRLYLREPGAEPLPEFERVAQQIKRCCLAAITRIP